LHNKVLCYLLFLCSTPSIERMERQINFKCGPLGRFTVYVDEPVMLLDNTIHHRQTKSGTLPLLFRREERVEYFLFRLCIHSFSGIRNQEESILLNLPVSMCLNKCLIHPCQMRPYRYLSTLRHGVSRISDEVHEHLLDLCAVSKDYQLFFRTLDRNFYVLPDKPQQEFSESRHNFVQTAGLEVDNAFPAE